MRLNRGRGAILAKMQQKEKSRNHHDQTASAKISPAEEKPHWTAARPALTIARMAEKTTAQDQITLNGSGIALMRGRTLIYEGVDFSLSSGDLLVVRGPNGSGKSSLLRAVAGFLPLASGQISCNGAPLNTSIQSGAVRCFWYSSADGLAGPLSAAQNLCLLPEAGDISKVKAKLADDDPFAISSFLDRDVRSLSTGQRQRVALSRLCFAMSHKCLWLLDEPNSGLDDAGHHALEDKLERHKAAGGLCIIASHHKISERLKPLYLDLGEA